MSRKCRVSTKTTKLFADRLSDLVDEKKKEMYSQKQIASSIGVSSGSLSEWCSDQVTATIDNLVQVARFFDVSADYLLGLTDVKSPKADIKSVNKLTGLDESAINQLIGMKGLSEATVALPSACANNLLIFYSHLISDIAITGAITLGVDRLVCFANKRELTESEEEVFDNVDEAISFYQYKIQETLKNFIIRFSQSTKLENGD